MKKTTGTSIKAILLLASGSVVMMLAIVSLVAWILYNSLGSALEQISKEAVPVVVTSHNLAMTSKSLSSIAMEMSLARNTTQLRQKAMFASMISGQVQGTLEKARMVLSDDNILKNLQQLLGQLVTTLDELEEAVQIKILLTGQFENLKKTFLSANDQVNYSLAQALKNQDIGITSSQTLLDESQYKWRIRYYLEMLSLVNTAERIVQTLGGPISLSALDRKKEKIHTLAERFGLLEDRLQEDPFAKEFTLFRAQLADLDKGNPSLFHLHGRLLKANAHEQSLIDSSNRLSAQIELLSASIVKNSNTASRQISEMAAKQIHRGKIIILLLVIISLGISVLMVWFFGGKQLAAPLLSLVKTVKRIERGNLSAKATVQGAKEIRELASTFNVMTEKLSLREQDLQKLHDLLTNVLNSLSSILIAVDHEMNVLLWNREATRFFQTSQKKALQQELNDCIFPFKIDTETIRSAITDNKVQLLKKVPHEKENKALIFDVAIFPLRFGSAKGAVVRIDDVTEKVRIEEAMIQSEKMLSVGGLAAGMAHEINNPLAAMMQNADLMHHRLTHADMPANRTAAQEIGVSLSSIKAYMEKRGILRMTAAISDSGRRLAEIVSNMLNFARKSEGNYSSHDIEDLLEKTLGLAATDFDLKKHFDFKAIQIKKDYEENLPLVPCEGSKIQQVLLNVLRNGAQAMQAAKTTSPQFIVRTRVEKKQKMACIEIEDNGPGMDEKTCKRVFEPFFTTKPVGVGTGLGLSVSYFIITENHQGEMTVESSLGKGTTFIIRLPLGNRKK
ncbi:MAG: HAMP domain-containing protein [Proteobacteria bacterium]|nr:HAMP domain-containing protein [Pseudomonadota bacterium]